MAKPDWRKEEDYAYTEDLTGEGWAWEFLRRSPTYRKAYQEFQKAQSRLIEEYGDEWRRDPRARVEDPPRREGENLRSWYRRVDFLEGKVARRFWPDQQAAEPFGLRGMYDPDIGMEQDVKFLNGQLFPQYLFLEDDVDTVMDEYEPPRGEDSWRPPGDMRLVRWDRALVAFDLELSIEGQLQDLGKRLNTIRLERGFKKPRAPSKLTKSRTRHLRALDALEDGAKHSDVGKALFPSNTKEGNGDVVLGESSPINTAPENGDDVDQKVFEDDPDPIERSRELRREAKKWLAPERYLRFLLMDE